MAILILMPDRDSRDLFQALKKIDPALDIRIWPEVGKREDIDYIVVWNPPAGELRHYPGVKVIASFGAGVDHIFTDPALPKRVLITRLVDDSLGRQMCEYIAGVILNQRLGLHQYREYQAASHWRSKAAGTGNNVCLLGLGNIGLQVARYLLTLDFSVCGWSRTAKSIENITTFHGAEALGEAVRNADYIVCLLPLTPQTENILDRSFFRKLKKGSCLINVARGGHLDENDLLEALGACRPAVACLDVFTEEPLPGDHLFWRHPAIFITPHCASLTNIDQAAIQLHENYLNMKNNQPLVNQVDPVTGY